MTLEEPQENYKMGWVSLYRSLCNKSWYKKPEYTLLWIHILIKASHSKTEFWFNGGTIKLNPGQFITGRKALSSETGINESKIERILKTFESEQQIEQQKSNKNRIITVLNWVSYQKNEQQSEQQVNNKRTTSEQQVNTINNVNNYNNENNKQSEYSKNDFLNSWNTKRKEILKTQSNLNRLPFDLFSDLKEISTAYSKEQIETALTGLFKQRKFPNGNTSMHSNPRHFLKYFESYLTAGNDKNKYLYGKPETE